MKKSIIIVCVFLLSGIAVLALAGIDPNPFRPEINQLGATANILNSANDRVVKSISNPPSDEPSPALNGAVNRLNAINNQLISVDNMVESIAGEVMGIDPNPFHEDVVSALEGVKGAAQGIVDYIHDNPMSSEVPEQFILAVMNVQNSAQAIVDTAEYYIEELNEIPPGWDCPGIHDPAVCDNTGGACIWVDGYCTHSP